MTTERAPAYADHQAHPCPVCLNVHGGEGLDVERALEVISEEYGPNAEIHVDSPKELADYLVDLYAALTERSAT